MAIQAPSKVVPVEARGWGGGWRAMTMKTAFVRVALSAFLALLSVSASRWKVFGGGDACA